MKKLIEADFDKIEKEVESTYPKREYSGIYDQVLHLKYNVSYLESEEGKKAVTTEFGSLKYDVQLDIMRKSLNTRLVELTFLKKSLSR